MNGNGNKTRGINITADRALAPTPFHLSVAPADRFQMPFNQANSLQQ